ncbi:MAG: tetratricopeptide repeat protein [Planctomycetota bacterium]
MRIVTSISLACGLVVALAGCQAGHGEYTTEARDNAIDRLNALKSGTSWEMGSTELRAGNVDRAYDHAVESLSLTPENPQGHLLLARVQIERGEFDGAMSSLDRALELDPGLAEPHYYRGVVLERFGQPRAAVASFQRALELDPTEVQYLLAAVEMMIEAGDLGGATDLLAEHEFRFRFSPAIRQTAGHIAMMRGDVEKAAAEFREASLLAPDDHAVLEDLARARIKLGQYAEAERSLERLFIDYAPIGTDASEAEAAAERADLLHMHARCLIELDRPLDARQILHELTRSPGGENDVEAWVHLGTVSIILEDPRGLRRAAQRLIAIAPQRYEGYYLLALWQQANDGPRAALAVLDKAVPRAEVVGNAQPANLQAVLYAQLGESARAAEAAAAALRADPTDARARALHDALTTATN